MALAPDRWRAHATYGGGYEIDSDQVKKTQ